MAQFPKEQSQEGSFQRQEDAFRKWVSQDADSEHPAKAGRYHLYISLACPWAHRTFIIRNLLGLQQAIGVTVVDPVRDEQGWAFRDGKGFSSDPINGFQFLSEAYKATDSDFNGRVTVPVLWDKEKNVIVNNSEDDICRMFAGAFAAFHTQSVDLFPSRLREEQEQLSSFIYENINNGVYKAGFASTQKVYEDSVSLLFEALGVMEKSLKKTRFLLGDQPLETDWRLFCTLIRFDPVYHGHFKCNVRQIYNYPHLSVYLRRLYQWQGIAETVHFDHIKRHYYMTHEDINPTRIVPIGPDLRWLSDPV
jgi:putative glutathione S-transferase